MKDSLLEVYTFTEPGFKPIIGFDSWRVAILNYLDEVHPTNIHFMERHLETDEVFVLQRGQAILFIGEGESAIEKISVQILAPGSIYNVKKGVWHIVVLSRDGSILLVENRDTDRGNSSYIELDQREKDIIVATSHQEIKDWQ